MSARSTFFHLAAKAGILFGALFLVSVLLAAIPGHRAPATPAHGAQESSGSQSPESQPMDHSKMSGMEMDDAKANEAHAVHDMTRGHMDAHNLHMHMTAMLPQTPEDAARANEIVAQLRSGIEKYKDYHVALNDGYKIFLPNLPHPNITSRITGTGSWSLSLSIRRGPLPCSTRRLQTDTNLWAPCTPCRNARRKNSSTRAFRSA